MSSIFQYHVLVIIEQLQQLYYIYMDWIMKKLFYSGLGPLSCSYNSNVRNLSQES